MIPYGMRSKKRRPQRRERGFDGMDWANMLHTKRVRTSDTSVAETFL